MTKNDQSAAPAVGREPHPDQAQQPRDELMERARLQRQVVATCGCGEAAQVISDLMQELMRLRSSSVPAAQLEKPQLAWEGPDEDGDWLIRLVGAPNCNPASVMAHGATIQLALHNFGGMVEGFYEDHCPDCVERRGASVPAATPEKAQP